MRGTTVKIYT